MRAALKSESRGATRQIATDQNTHHTAIVAEQAGSINLVTPSSSEPRIDSRDMAVNLGNRHKSVFELLKTYKADFEVLGILRFQTEVFDGPGQPEKYALLNEDQAYLLLTYSRNTTKIRELKMKLVKAFGEARRSRDLHNTEYLPGYHELHDELHQLADGSSSERFVHMNINKLLNHVDGIGSGQRGAAPLLKKSILCVAQTVAATAMRGASDHHQAYRQAKQALSMLSAATMLGVTA